ncbi:DUF262 domain-containing protein [Serinicoccus chungangensis]|uniref:DUF262 domain-containing protein n=1 Tax=Serinicoccus chungangensis TaxID=767452 RepID=UPI0011185EE3|nr:DUF262 domain-containing protein [Serinicoccus chungangensis]
MAQAPTFDQPQAIPVGKLFCNHGDRYSIPLYQRNYTWGEEEIHRLIHDVLDEAERDDQKAYFLGNLVVAPPSDPRDPFDVIDGQQRLTTLYILLTRPELQGQVGSLQPLVYEAREKATRALHGIIDADRSVTEDPNREDSGILRAVHIIDQFLQDPRQGARFLSHRVLDYLLHNVFVIRMPIDRSLDLNKYFEIMNTRGAQLSPVDIVKARLLRQLADPADRALLNHVWTACSDMEHYVTMTATPGDAAWRTEVFGKNWEDLPTADFAALRALLVDGRTDTGEPDVSTLLLAESTALTFDDAVAGYARTAVSDETSRESGDDRFTSQITFPTLLLHVLAIRRPTTDETGDDRQLDDKLLVKRFSDQLEDLDHARRPDWVREFTTDLLRTRHLFDTYILKRDATLTTGHESTTDDEPGSWSLYRLSRGESQGKQAPRYRPTFAADDSASGPWTLQRQILLLQSALRITYTSPRTMHWITDVLRYVTLLADRGERVDAQGVLDRIESFALSRLEEGLRPRARPGHEPETSPDGLPLGFALPRIVFTYLDYLLVLDWEAWDFTFSYRTSLEHFSPQVEDSEHLSDAFRVRDKRLLDWLGNLALVTVSANSHFSNYLPREKARNESALRQSIKLRIMAARAKAGRWNDEDISAHHEDMVGLLRAALANRPTIHDEHDASVAQTGRHTQ